MAATIESKNTAVRMDSGIRKHKMCLGDICSLPYGRIDYIRFKGTSLQAGYLSISAPPAVCSVLGLLYGD